jgi:enamine deaminase RidA (YjgF/YER057c/UK114 family)
MKEIAAEAPPDRPWNDSPQALRRGKLIFIPGHMSLDKDGEVVGDTVAEQTQHILEAVERALADAGATMADIVKHNVFFTCANDAEAIARAIGELDSVRTAWFKAPGPVTTETRVGLPRKSALVMIDGVAVVGPADKQPIVVPDHWTWKRPLPFVQGWKVDDLVFVGGQRSLDRCGTLVGSSDVAVQTENVLRSFEAVLHAAGTDRNSVVRQHTNYRVFGAGPEATAYWEQVMKVRLQYMSRPTPAGIGLGVTGFADAGELIEVEGIASFDSQRRRLQPENHWGVPAFPAAEFSQGWKAGGLVFVGGQVSVDRNSKAVGLDLVTQTRNVFRYIRNVLAEAELDESDVVRLGIFYLDGPRPEVEKTLTTIANVQREFYPEPGPCITAYGVDGYSFHDLFVEMEAIAVVRR